VNQAILALLAGLLTIAAPCILPMLPILLGASIGQTSRARPAFIALGFILAFSASALVFGLFASALGLSQDILRDGAIVLLLLFGALMLWKRPFDLLAQRMGSLLNWASDKGNRAGAGNAGGLVLGMTLGVVWTPCAGPVLASILTLVAAASDIGRAAGLLFCYALGAGIPMLLIAYGGQMVSTRVRRLARYASAMQQVFGVIVIATAIAMFLQYDALITLWLADWIPSTL
jgi:cytochrome c biogenesis protein CcdA